MTILPNGIIYIIGGDIASLLPGLDSQGFLQWSLNLAPMGSIVVYDTVKGTWATKTATGTIPPSRNFHSATLGRRFYNTIFALPFAALTLLFSRPR